jgi:cytoskeletal protein RodZ
MTTTDPDRTPGYRGALPPREDRLARPWILLVIAAFVLILVLSVLGVPSRFIPEPTPVPLPSVPAASFSVEPSASVSASASASASASPSAAEEASPSPTSE